MSEQTTANALLALSRQLEHLAEAAAHAVVGIRLHERLVASGFVWKLGVVVTASDALEADDDISVIAAAGKVVSARVAGRDPTTDVAVLRLSDNLPEPARATMSDAARVGQLVLGLGRGEDGVIANLGMVSVAGGRRQTAGLRAMASVRRQKIPFARVRATRCDRPGTTRQLRP
jgi:S1-C subfamily serine protease